MISTFYKKEFLSMKWKRHLRLFLMTLGCLCLFSGTAYAEEESGDVMADGIMIDSLDVGGMTADEAEKAVEEYFEKFRSGILRLSFNGDTVEIGFDELGITWDNPNVIEDAMACGKSGNVLQLYKELTQLRTEKKNFPIEYSLDETLIQDFLQQEADDRETEPVEATITKEGKKFEVTQSATGLTVDVPATLNMILDAAQNDWMGGILSIDAEVEILEPKYKTEELKLIQDCLGEHTTKFDKDNLDRLKNVSNGSHFLDGNVLLPGESMSLYDYMYPCTEENGYTYGIAYANGGYLDSIGAGICQVSTTMYNALLKAELKVLTRSPHSMTVSYAEPGFDSAQSAGSKDLSFMNNTDYPIYVEAWAADGKVHAALWGKDDRDLENRKVEYYNVILSNVPPGEPIYTEDPNLPEGKTVMDQSPYNAIKAELYKQVTVNGQVVETTLLHTDRYRASPAKYRVGTGAPEEPAPEEGGEGQENPGG